MVEAIKADVVREKSRIVSYLTQIGPSVINNIAKSLNMHSFLAAALLSELANDKTLKSSWMKVGGSPLYFIKGQEEQLEKFTNFMNHKEREAIILLKKEGVLLDKELEPAIRVALRNTKDFAIPLNITKGNEETIAWKYSFFNGAEEKIKLLLGEEPKKQTAESKKQVEEPKEKQSDVPKPEKKVKSEKISQSKSDFEKWANTHSITIQEILLEKRGELKAKVTVKSNIGEIDFLAIYKDKKSISESDLSLAYQEGLNIKLPALFITNGKLTKNSQQYLEGLGSNILFRKV